MTNILLTGAGFSRNWGGWLATEAFEYLLGAPEVDDQLRGLLWQDNLSGDGFEDTLARLQLLNQTAPNETTTRLLNALTAALVGMFNLMGLTFLRKTFEFQTDRQYQVGQFLCRFDEIYTLNQDTLLEYHYHNDNIMLANPQRFSGFQLPGMRSAANQPIGGRPFERIGVRTAAPDAEFRIEPRSQPYFKLHGSANWNSDNGCILIMGGNKATNIDTYPVLAWYHRHFKEQLRRPGAKLMVIGYSFSDDHINEAIIQGLAAGMKLFIIDPAGTDVLIKRNILTPKPDVLMPMLTNIVGGSRRPLYETFNQDHVEHAKVLRFLAS